VEIRPPKENIGTIVIGGGGRYDARMWTTLVWANPDLTGGPRRLLIDTSATIEDHLAHEKAQAVARKLAVAGGTSVILPRPLPSATCAANMLAQCDGVWFTGGFIGAIAHRYRHSLMQTQLRRLLMRGGLIGGTSAGAVALCQTTWNQKSKTRIGKGLGLIPDLILSVHANSKRRDHLLKLQSPIGTMKLALTEGEYVVLPVAGPITSGTWDAEMRRLLSALQDGVRDELRNARNVYENCPAHDRGGGRKIRVA
jgi:cyanophycinase-like exopeptidase